MKEKLNLDNINLDFLSEDSKPKLKTKENYKIMIADDYDEIHVITKMMLKDFEFEGKGLEFIDTYTGEDTIKALEKNPDTAVLFLDVVMEDNHSGLNVVEVLRGRLDNKMTRIVLRTGQPGQAPEETVIRDYDINDYRLKTEMTAKRLYTILYSALRNYRDLYQINTHKNGLKKIIKTSANLFEHNSLNEFLTSILVQLSNFQKSNPERVYIRDDVDKEGGFVTIEKNKKATIVAATGKFKSYIGKDIDLVSELKEVVDKIKYSDKPEEKIIFVDSGFIIKNNAKNSFNNYIYIEGNNDIYDFDLIHLFLTNYSVALDNYILNNTIVNTQKDIIITFGEVVENHFEETSGHVKRISEMMYNFALLLNFSHSEAEILKMASMMHDIGKIAIPDSILKKPGKLTEEEILLEARMLSIIDVFDAMTHKRVYKDAFSTEEALDYIRNQKGKHFDPELVDIFISNIEGILDID